MNMVSLTASLIKSVTASGYTQHDKTIGMYVEILSLIREEVSVVSGDMTLINIHIKSMRCKNRGNGRGVTCTTVRSGSHV